MRVYGGAQKPPRETVLPTAKLSYWYAQTDASDVNVGGRADIERVRKFDLVMAWSVDRLGRSLQDLVGFLGEIHALRIDQALFQLMGVFAEFERSTIVARACEPEWRAQGEGDEEKSGRAIGRPPIDPQRRAAIRLAYEADGIGMRKVPTFFGLGDGARGSGELWIPHSRRRD
jgi:DNA invertase Pin-like site-specific DNA recombinase